MTFHSYIPHMHSLCFTLSQTAVTHFTIYLNKIYKVTDYTENLNDLLNCGIQSTGIVKEYYKYKIQMLNLHCSHSSTQMDLKRNY